MSMNEAQLNKLEEIDAEYLNEGLTQDDLINAAQNAQDLCYDERQTENGDLWLKYYEATLSNTLATREDEEGEDYEDEEY